MKDIYRELTTKYRRESAGDGAGRSTAERDMEVLSQTDDPLWYAALSPERINIIESFPWKADMSVLCLGACYGSFLPVAERVKSFDILDDDPGHGEFVSYRYPGISFGFLSMDEASDKASGCYDAVILSLIDNPCRDAEKLIRTLSGFLKPQGSLILAAANADALKYMVGAKPPAEGSAVSRELLERVCSENRFRHAKNYYPIPDAYSARRIYSDDIPPSPDAFRGISESPFEKRFIFCNEERLYARLSGTDAISRFVPAYLTVFTGDSDIYSELPSYIKYNRMRDLRYALKTEIFTECPGRPAAAVKTALTPAANDHIRDFLMRADILEKEADGRFGILKPVIAVNSRGLCQASFPIIRGMDLGKKLSLSIKNGLAPHAQIETAVELLLGKSGSSRNLDALFENLITGPDGSPALIDYEWLSNEETDRDFLIYRMLRYWYEAYSGLLTGYEGLDELLSEFGISGSMAEAYAKRELGFQNTVRGNMKTLEEHFAKPQEYVTSIQDRLRLIDELKEELRGQEEALSKEREVERLSQNHIRNIELINKQRETELEALSTRAAYLEKHQSLGSRLAAGIIAAIDRAAPAGSRKRALIHLSKKALKSPVSTMRQILSGEGRILISGEIEVGEGFADGGILHLQENKENPLVSIVIPVYNEVAYTYACIKSILENTDQAETPYEVILADDVSTDATAHISRYITGLVISRNTVNTGFLKNCSQAAAKAGGKYIFFLNNDTIVHKGWLSSLVKLMESDSSIGMAGSKLVYPDGRLQEAGGIIWSDASGWNYGRLDNPDKPQYNYVKEVDYISGAAIMIRRSLWEEIGGFDERYAPAYCEDSDLAFEVRRHGKKVVYQPSSVVTHFEGISNGTDTAGTGLKRYQVANTEKFREKWAEELKGQQANTGSPNPFTARDRSQGKKCIVVIDHYVPTWDRDAGSRTTYQYLRMFVKKGFNVKFIGDNFLSEEPYTSTLEQLGIEVLYGAGMQAGIFDWFRENSRYIDICYLNRPHIAAKYIDFLKKETDIKCIFYGHDLHFLRIWREYELTGDLGKLRESEYWKSTEISVMRKADMVYYPSDTETAEILRIHPEIPVKAVTAYVWDEFKSVYRTEADFAAGKDLLFVGGFRHPPNADGVKWFAEKIFPLIRRELPDVRFLIAGSGAGEDILSLAGPASGIEVLGFVSDERLSGLYNETRLTVVPLRYGAGVKGKVVEAIYNGCAVVTTSVGAEGIPDAGSIMEVVDDDPHMIYENAAVTEASFAAAVIRLYNDTGKLCRMSRQCAQFIRDNYSMDAAWKTIAEDFG